MSSFAVWFSPPTRVLLAASIASLLGQSAFAQASGNNQSAAKLGAPGIAAPAGPQADPGTLFAFSNSIGKTMRFSVVGNTGGTIWGDGVYTSDSVLAAAAVHAGLLQPGQAGIVSVEIVEGPEAYAGAERNGVASRPYGPWDVAFRLIDVTLSNAVILPDPGDLTGYRGQNGVTLIFEVTGVLEGAVWGDGVYTDDSRLGAAAVHGGVLQPGQTGLVTVEILPGQDSYDGAERNGILSGTYAAWSGSYRVTAVSSKVASKLAN